MDFNGCQRLAVHGMKPHSNGIGVTLREERAMALTFLLLFSDGVMEGWVILVNFKVRPGCLL